jgi:hypothetical protein
MAEETRTPDEAEAFPSLVQQGVNPLNEMMQAVVP